MFTDTELRSAPFPDTFDNTMRVMAATCPRKFYWFLRGYDYSETPAYFTWGKAWHEILRIWYSSTEDHDGDPNSPEFWNTVAKAVAAGQEMWDSEGGIDYRLNNRAALLAIFKAYVEQYPREPWKMVAEGDERGWVWPVEGTPYYLAGSIDLYVEWPGYGFMPLENKSAGGYLSDSYVQQWDFSTQVSGYTWYATQLHGEDCFGTLVNMATKNIPGPRANWTTARFQRSLQRRSPFQLEEYIEDFLWDIENLQRCWDQWRWPKTSDVVNCAGGTGKAPCLFRPLCNLDQHFTQTDPLMFRGISLREEEWKPWERIGDQE